MVFRFCLGERESDVWPEKFLIIQYSTEAF
jgi:hypothetical protein